MATIATTHFCYCAVEKKADPKGEGFTYTHYKCEWCHLREVPAQAEVFKRPQLREDEDIYEMGRRTAHNPLTHFPEIKHLTPNGKAGLK